MNYSTFEGRRLINIHDFIVAPGHRGKGAGYYLLKAIEDYGRKHNFCRINLEVREDNVKARALYRKFGFGECSPPMSFWEKWL
ncbi:MAG: GNAT family N-acetyltransferase [Bacteroidota bacterium]